MLKTIYLLDICNVVANKTSLFYRATSDSALCYSHETLEGPKKRNGS